MMNAKSTFENPKLVKTPGTIKTRDYPTTWLLKHSKWDDLSLSSSDKGHQSPHNYSGDDYMETSDISELVVATE